MKILEMEYTFRLGEEGKVWEQRDSKSGKVWLTGLLFKVLMTFSEPVRLF